MVRDNRHDSAYLFGAICHARKLGAAIIMPTVNSEAMGEQLKEISALVAPSAHAVVVCDGAGWHQPGERLRVPDNVTLLPLPPYSPELNPTEITSAATNSACAFGTATRQSSRPARKLGSSSSAIPTESIPSRIGPGYGSIFRSAGITMLRTARKRLRWLGNLSPENGRR